MLAEPRTRTPARVANPFVGRDILCFSHDWSGERTPAGFIDPGDARHA